MTEYPTEDAHPLDAERAEWYRNLLAKYMRHVGEYEGSTFVHHLIAGYGGFDEVEVAELHAIEDGIDWSDG